MPDMPDRLSFLKCTLYNILTCSVLISLFTSCSPNTSTDKSSVGNKEKQFYAGKGVGPVKEVKLEELNSTMISEGKELFLSKCITCHHITEEKLIGPGLKGVTIRRTPEWIMNQILNPIGMTQSDSMAKELLLIYYSQMTPMGLSETEARRILEYFRSVDAAQVSN